MGVAVQDVDPGEAWGVHMDSEREVRLSALEPIPLGHKIALADLEAGADLVEYGVRVGLARSRITRGSLVHTHNVRSARWQQSQ